MTFTFTEIMAVIIIHWFSDFILQTDWMAQNKSKSNKALFAHVASYSMSWLVVILCLLKDFSPDSISKVMIFFYITFAAHFCTDYVTSRINSKLWANKQVHWFFVSVGFDQVLHYTQLFLTLYLVKTM